MISKIGVVFAISIYLCIWVRFRNKIRLLNISTIIVSLIYVYLLLSITLADRIQLSYVAVDITPFHSYYGILARGWNGEGFYIAQSLLGNVILFLPLGIVFSVVFQENKEKILAVALCALMISLSIELIQYSFCLGTFEVDDLIHNTLGGVFGLLLAESVMLFDSNNKNSLYRVANMLMPLFVFSFIFGAVCIVSIIKLWIVQNG